MDRDREQKGMFTGLFKTFLFTILTPNDDFPPNFHHVTAHSPPSPRTNKYEIGPDPDPIAEKFIDNLSGRVLLFVLFIKALNGFLALGKLDSHRER